MRTLLTVLLLIFLRATPTWAATYYISPTGNDSNPGTAQGTPWKTFSRSIAALFPGDTLFLLNGTYSAAAGTGMPQWHCPGGSGYISSRHGTASQPITIKALNERQAIIQGAGQLVLLSYSCFYWNIEGITGRNTDGNPGGGFSGSIFTIWSGDHLVLRRNLAYNTNAWFNSHCYDTDQMTNTLMEENECYYVHRHGILLFNAGPGNTIRRNYVHSRDHANIPGGFDTGEARAANRGDEGISCYPCRGNIIENNIVEDFDSAYTIQCKFNCNDNVYLGNIALTSGNGIGFGARADTNPNSLTQMPANEVVENHVIVNANALDSGCTTCKNLIIRNLTYIDSPSFGLTLKKGSSGNGEAGDGSAVSWFGTNILMSGDSFLDVSGQDSWSMDRSILYNNPGGYSPALGDSHYTNTSTSNPNLGTCKVYIPDGSPAKGAGTSGGDIGANILYRYQDGTLTATPLWDTGTGAFPCGATVSGINDTSGNSCIGVHTRLNVNTGGCAFPASFTGTPVVNTLVAHWKLDEASGTSGADFTGNGHTGTVVGAPVWSGGRVGPHALTLNGLLQNMTVVSTTDLQLASSFSLAVWLKPVTAGAGGFARVFDKRGAGSPTTGYHMLVRSDTNAVGLAINAAAILGQNEAQSAAGTLTYGAWQHWVVTVSGGSTVKFYKNGVPVAQEAGSGTFTQAALPNSTPLVIGGADGRTDRNFDGGLDEPRVYNFALSDADVLFLYRSTVGMGRHSRVSLR